MTHNPLFSLALGATKLLHEVEVKALATEFRYQIDKSSGLLLEVANALQNVSESSANDAVNIKESAKKAKAEVERAIGRIVDALLQRKKQLNRMIDEHVEAKLKILNVIQEASAAESTAATNVIQAATQASHTKPDADLIQVAEPLLAALHQAQSHADAVKSAVETCYSPESAEVSLHIDEQDAVLQVSMLGLVDAPQPPAFLPDLATIGSNTAEIRWEPLTIPGVTQPSGALAMLSTLAATSVSLDSLRPGAAPLALKRTTNSVQDPKLNLGLNENVGLFQLVANAAASTLNVPHSRGFIVPGADPESLPPAPVSQPAAPVAAEVTQASSAVSAATPGVSHNLAHQLSANGLVPGHLTGPSADEAIGASKPIYSGHVIEAPKAPDVLLTAQGNSQGTQFVSIDLVSPQGPNDAKLSRASAAAAIAQLAEEEFKKQAQDVDASGLLPTPVTYTIIWARAGSAFANALEHAGPFVQVRASKPLITKASNELALSTSTITPNRCLSNPDSTLSVIERSPAVVPEYERAWNADEDIAGAEELKESDPLASLSAIAPTVPRSLMAHDEGVAEGVRTPSFTIEGLEADTVYRVYIRSESTSNLWARYRAPLSRPLVIKTGKRATVRPVQIGGADPSKTQVQLESAEILSVGQANAAQASTQQSKWKALPQLNVRRAFASAALLLDRIVVTGGFNSLGLASNPVGSVHSSLSTTAEILSHTQMLVGPNAAPSAAKGAGSQAGATILRSVEALDLEHHRWVPMPDMLTPRRWHASVSIGNKLYVLGGFDGTNRLRACEVFDPRTGIWSPIAPMHEARDGHAAVALPTGHIFVMGGYNGTQRVASCEIYDINKNVWRRVASMRCAREGLAAATFVCPVPTSAQALRGRYSKPGDSTKQTQLYVYATGGYDGTDYLRSTEVYDPIRNLWLSGPPLRSARYLHSVFVVPKGTLAATGENDGLIVTGGMNKSADCIRYCELLVLSDELLQQIVSNTFAEALQAANSGLSRTKTGALRASAPFDASARSRLHEEDVSMGMYSSPSTKTLLLAATAETPSETPVAWMSISDLSAARAGAAAVLLPSYADLPQGIPDYAEL